jgi:hypothetical protein
MPGLFGRLPATILGPFRRTLCTPFSAFVGLFVSGLIFSNLSALGEEKSLFLTFIFNKFSA